MSEIEEQINNLSQKIVELYQQGEYTETIILALQALNLAQKILGNEHPYVVACLNNLAALYQAQGQYKEAESLMNQALVLAQQLWGNEHHLVADSLNNLASLYDDQGRYSEAEPLYKQALDSRRCLLGDEHLDVAGSLNNLALLYQNQGRYREAEPLYVQALELTRHLEGNEHPNVLASLNNLASLYQYQGRYSEAEPLFKQVLDLRRHLLGTHHPDVGTSLNNLALLYNAQGRFSEAESLFKQALDLRRQLLGDEHPDVATIRNNLGLLYQNQGRFSEAESLFKQVLDLRRQLLGDEHPDVVGSLNNLALTYRHQGRYNEAEPLYEEALKLCRRLLGDEHPSVATCLNSLASIYQDRGLYSEAESLFKQALELRQQLLGNENPDVVSSLDNLAALYHYQADYSKAELLFKQALNMRRHLLGERHPDVALSLNNLAESYRMQRRYSEAETLHKEGLYLTRYLLGDEHPYVATSLNNLARIYRERGRYREAEPLLSQALYIRKNQFGDTHPSVAISLNSLAALFIANDRLSKALKQMLRAAKIDDLIIYRVFSYSSESDRLAYLRTLRGNFYAFISLVYNHLSNSHESLQVALDLILKRKALTASALAAQNEALYSERYSNLTEDFHKLRDLSEQIVHFTFFTSQTEDFTTYQQQLAKLQAEHNNLQKKLASQVPEIQLQEQLPSRSDVAAELPAGSILIEFVRFDVFNFKAIPAKGEAQWQSARYLAFILPAGQPESVEMVDIGKAEYIDSLIQEFRELRSRTVSKGGMWSSTRRLSFKQYDPQAGIKLRQAIFDKLRPALKEHQHLIIAPDGELNLVPFQILPNDDTGEKMLMDEFTISYLSVGRDILRQKIETKRPASLNALVLASPNFDLSAESVTSNAAREQNTQTANLRECIANKPLKPAVGTNILGERVAQKFKVASYLRNEALESYFKPLKCPRILLVATHGVFLPNQPEDRSSTFPYKGESDLLQRDGSLFGRVENPMLRSALALAGANTWAKGGKLPPEAGKGILFAQDIAGLDLWANEITVLSACETGIGDVAIGEGVFGLRRAFAVAGAKTLIMSLWSVKGWTTALLMERFFDNCEAGNGRAAALQEAQNYVRNITVGELQQFELGREILKHEFNNGRELDTAILARQAEDKPLAHPDYWGAWICQGDTTPLPFTACS